MNKLALAAILIAAPLAAHAEVGVRVGVGADVAYHYPDGTHFITDNWPLTADFMLSYWTPGSLLSIDAEIGEQFFLNAPAGGSSRIGTIFRPGIRLSPPVLPIYLRGAIPILIETPYSTGRETFDLRLGAGITIPLILFKVYIEADVDFPLGGGTNPPSAFSNWQLWLNGGLDFRF